MPTPLQILLDPISLIVIALYLGLMIWEAVFPARPLPYVKYWKLKGVIFFAIYFYLSSYLPMFWNEFLSAYQLFDLTSRLAAASKETLQNWERRSYVKHTCVFSSRLYMET